MAISSASVASISLPRRFESFGKPSRMFCNVIGRPSKTKSGCERYMRCAFVSLPISQDFVGIRNSYLYCKHGAEMHSV